MKEIKLLQVGDDAPEVRFTKASGEVCSSADLKGNPFLVYFYPKDNTPGCNKEACGFRDLHPDFEKISVTIIGVSCDSEKSHEKFRDKFELPFALVADEDQSVVHAFGVFGKKKFMGKTYEGIHRVSYLINADGQVAKVYPKVKPAEHAEEVLKDLKELAL